MSCKKQKLQPQISQFVVKSKLIPGRLQDKLSKNTSPTSVPSGLLPYSHLIRTFDALEGVLNFLSFRGQMGIYHNIKASVQRVSNIDFTLSLLCQLASVGMYTLKPTTIILNNTAVVSWIIEPTANGESEDTTVEKELKLGYKRNYASVDTVLKCDSRDVYKKVEKYSNGVKDRRVQFINYLVKHAAGPDKEVPCAELPKLEKTSRFDGSEKHQRVLTLLNKNTPEAGSGICVFMIGTTPLGLETYATEHVNEKQGNSPCVEKQSMAIKGMDKSLIVENGVDAPSTNQVSTPNVTSYIITTPANESNLVSPDNSIASPNPTSSKPISRAKALLNRIKEKQRAKAEEELKNPPLSLDQLRLKSSLSRLSLFASSILMLSLTSKRSALGFGRVVQHLMMSLDHLFMSEGVDYINLDEVATLVFLLAKTCPFFCGVQRDGVDVCSGSGVVVLRQKGTVGVKEAVSKAMVGI